MWYGPLTEDNFRRSAYYMTASLRVRVQLITGGGTSIFHSASI